MRHLLFSGYLKRRWRYAEYGFAAIGVAALGYCLMVFLHAKFFQSRAERRFEEDVRLHQGRTPTPAGSIAPVVPENGSVVGRLEVGRIGLSVAVVEGIDDRDLKLAAGHIPGTPIPGEHGNVGIAAHRDTFFRPLHSIRQNDTITLSSLLGTYRYRVVSTKVVSPENIEVLYPTSDDSLTLVTCFPFDYVGAAPKRFIVRAERISGL